MYTVILCTFLGKLEHTHSEFCLHIKYNVATMAADEAKSCEEKEKIVTATKKGAAVLDQWLPDYVKAQYHVLQMASLVE